MAPLPMHTASMTDSARDRRSRYVFGCPEGTWPARLDDKAWSKKTAGVLRLFFTRIDTGERFALYSFHRNSYRPTGWGPNFHREVKIGDALLLTTGHTKTGKPKLIEASVVPEMDGSLRVEAVFNRAAA